jgi:UDP-N-acetylglucosamine transferase subunit ALG13
MENEPSNLDKKIEEPAKSGAADMVEKPNPQAEFESALEKQTPERRALLTVANSLLSEGVTVEVTKLDNRQLVEQLQSKFQENIENHYRQTGLADKIKTLPIRENLNPTDTPLDQQVVNLIAEESQGTHGWVDMLPNLRKEAQQAGLNCTMGSALLHLALEDLGFDQVRTVLRAGHHVVIRETDDGSIKLYDPTSLSTKDDRLVGYSREFTADEIKRKQDIPGKGFGFELTSDTEDKIGGFMDSDEDGQYRQSFFAYEPEIKMDLAIALENLSEIKDDAAKIESEQTTPFDIDAYREALAAFIRENNTVELSDADITEIANSNRQPIEELTQAASSFYGQDGQIPNPYDFLSSPLLKPKQELTQSPNPKDFAGSSERYEQASELCKKYPELKTLDSKTIQSKLELFDGHNYL